jgi:SAM-dependent methyltransferase
MMKEFHKYGNEFDNASAEIIVPELTKLMQINSVVDVGCGLGNWLSVFEQNGIQKLIGIDGEHAKRKFILNEKHFIATDFENIEAFKTILNEKVDLAICLEVLEHLSENTGKRIVDFLCNASDVILFSAAIPHQTGENHINEQHPVYWQELFAKRGFIFYDIFRQKYWNNSQIKWWYKQNMFLVAREGTFSRENFPIFQGDLRIHPEMLEMYLHEIAELKRKKGLKSKIKKYLK